MYRLAGAVRLSVAGRDGIVEQTGKPALLLRGDAARLRSLAAVMGTPRREDWLRSVLARAQPAGVPGDLVGRLIDEGVLIPWDLGTRLAELHARTTRATEWPAVNPGLESGRLLRDYAGDEAVPLPPPQLRDADLVAALRARRSARQFAGNSVSLSDLATLLALGAGCTSGSDFAAQLLPEAPPPVRTYPSGGALYPVDVIACPLRVPRLAPRFCLYQPLPHQLVTVGPVQPVDRIASWFPNHPIADAAVLILLAMDFARPSLGKYGERAYRLALLEAGHLAQNILLLTTALGLAGLPICGFDDEQVSMAAGLTFPDAAVVYVLALGTPARADPGDAGA